MGEVGGVACTAALRDGLRAFDSLVRARDTVALDALVRPCTPVASDMDAMALEAAVFAPYQRCLRASDADGLSWADVCALWTADGLSPVAKLGLVHAAALDAAQAQCTSSSYARDWVAPVAAEWAADEGNNARQWTYQMCTGLGLAQPTAGSASAFAELSYVTLDSVFTQYCADVFGVENATARVEATRAQLAGADWQATCVVLVGGSADPWTALMPPSTLVVHGGTTGADMYVGDQDSAALVDTHKRLEAAIATFLSL